jgi:hypothetical protein
MVKQPVLKHVSGISAGVGDNGAEEAIVDVGSADSVKDRIVDGYRGDCIYRFEFGGFIIVDVRGGHGILGLAHARRTGFGFLDIRVAGQGVGGGIGDAWDMMDISIESGEEFVPADLTGGTGPFAFSNA